MKNLTASDLELIKSVIKNNRFFADRVATLVKKGFVVGERRMGTGGVGKVMRLQDEVRVQISAGYGKYNYAKVVIFNA